MSATIPTPEQEQRAKWDLLLADIEMRQEQLRQMKAFEPWRLLFQGVTTGASIFAAGVALTALLLRSV